MIGTCARSQPCRRDRRDSDGSVRSGRCAPPAPRSAAPPDTQRPQVGSTPFPPRSQATGIALRVSEPIQRPWSRRARSQRWRVARGRVDNCTHVDDSNAACRITGDLRGQIDTDAGSASRVANYRRFSRPGRRARRAQATSVQLWSGAAHPPGPGDAHPPSREARIRPAWTTRTDWQHYAPLGSAPHQ